MKRTIITQIKAPSRNQWILFLLSAMLILLNLLQGSRVRVVVSICESMQLEETVLYLSIFAGVVFFFISGWKVVVRSIMPVLMASALVFSVESYISDYQMQVTTENLEATCDAIYDFQSQNGRLPESIHELENSSAFTSGFKLFNDRFIYEKTKSGFIIYYEVKYGVVCEAWNCHTFFANMKYTCGGCTDLSDDRFEAY